MSSTNPTTYESTSAPNSSASLFPILTAIIIAAIILTFFILTYLGLHHRRRQIKNRNSRLSHAHRQWLRSDHLDDMELGAIPFRAPAQQSCEDMHSFQLPDSIPGAPRAYLSRYPGSLPAPVPMPRATPPVRRIAVVISEAEWFGGHDPFANQGFLEVRPVKDGNERNGCRPDSF